MKEYKNVPLEELDMSVRLFQDLKRIGVKDSDGVLLTDPEGFSQVRGVSERSVIELITLQEELYEPEKKELWALLPYDTVSRKCS